MLVIVAFSEFQTIRVCVGLATSVTLTQARSKLIDSSWYLACQYKVVTPGPAGSGPIFNDVRS